MVCSTFQKPWDSASFSQQHHGYSNPERRDHRFDRQPFSCPGLLTTVLCCAALCRNYEPISNRPGLDDCSVDPIGIISLVNDENPARFLALSGQSTFPIGEGLDSRLSSKGDYSPVANPWLKSFVDLTKMANNQRWFSFQCLVEPNPFCCCRRQSLKEYMAHRIWVGQQAASHCMN